MGFLEGPRLGDHAGTRALQSSPPGDVFAGEVGCLLRRDPDTIVGIDVAYFARGVLQRAS
jgi:hypothetical protein